MRPSLRPSRDVHGLTRMLGEGCDDKEAGDTGTPVARHCVVTKLQQLDGR